MKHILPILFVLLSFPTSAQISFLDSQTSWKQLSEKAKKENKLIFIHLEDDQCRQCYEVAAQGFASSILKEKFEQNFVSIRVNVNTKNGKRLTEKFDIKGALICLFIDADGNILHRYNGSASAGFIYAEQADIAISRKSRKSLSEYEKEYVAGERSLRFFEEYIERRREVSLPTGNLLDQYFGQLPVDSLNNFRIIKFIYTQGPVIDSRAYKTIQAATNKNIIDSLYKSSPMPEAIAINNAIIGNSFRKAVENKDSNLAYQLAYFIRNSYGRDHLKGSIAHQRNMIRYYLAVKDTVNFLESARNFLEFTHKRFSIDSLKKWDEQDAKKNAFPIPSSGARVPVSVSRFAPSSQSYYQELNEFAWNFYKMCDKVEDLEKALEWSKKSMEWFDELTKGKGHPMSLGNPAYIDTYAHLLYKLGRKEEAVQWQTKAVEAQKITGASASSFEETLEEMKTGKL